MYRQGYTVSNRGKAYHEVSDIILQNFVYFTSSMQNNFVPSNNKLGTVVKPVTRSTIFIFTQRCLSLGRPISIIYIGILSMVITALLCWHY